MTFKLTDMEFTGQLYVLCSCCRGNDTLLDLDGVPLDEVAYELIDAGWRGGVCPDCHGPAEPDPSDFRKEFLEREDCAYG
jgi:hypothetical protein